ncbi:cyclic di-AMP binding protein CbpA [Facklamia miroungae]|uniref:CBS domain-containing protein n=1 Tax=Facklamia miroungae TaxID=120956 RepID=A0A1G7S2J9_9LACT|nr:cyclic di-AMP binding protein CbpA [Facklamia miroungae]NKZ29187.1 CBS domain-containing protein [Facklamia miroungae]SDG17181.1 CBS domain-containing protein [Facklamia miroungae]
MIEELMKPKNTILTLPETYTCMEAIELLEKNNLRCAPVVDDSQSIFRGNIYRYHIYQYKFHHPEADLKVMPVTRFLKNTTKVIRIHHSILELFFAIKDLPYVAVLSQENTFMGIVEHTRFLNFLNQAWDMPVVGYILKVEALGQKGDLAKIARLVNRYCDISSSMTIDKTEYNNRSYILFQIHQDTSRLTFQNLVQDLQRRKYSVEQWFI